MILDPPGFLKRDERTCLFVDGANLYAAARSLGLQLDFGALLAHVRDNTRLVRAYYYSALLDTDDYTPVRPLVDWLSYNGWSVVTKTAREFTDPQTGHRRTKGNMDIELAIDMLELAPSIEHAVL
ncbi:MAG: NYN domain-containing protein, partial [Gluconacetobacter diazotrophicus]|nr:NYN domain-containing protein [Gluconacetobacter diazotrophicus]